jgi:hypothetical protein
MRIQYDREHLLAAGVEYTPCEATIHILQPH